MDSSFPNTYIPKPPPWTSSEVFPMLQKHDRSKGWVASGTDETSTPVSVFSQ